MTDGLQEEYNRIERDLWEAADNLRANSKLASSEYFMPVLGIIFLRHASCRHDAALAAIGADLAREAIPDLIPTKADFLSRRALKLPDKAHWRYLVTPPKPHPDLGKALTGAMEAIEAEYPTILKNVLPKDYGIFERSVLDDLLRIFNREALNSASGDVFGKIYEYFLMNFANQKAYDDGEFFTPPSIVQTIVNVIEPDHGYVFDPACGSGGMFVQTSHFIERQGQDTAKRVVFRGQEKTATTIRIARMNLAVHGLEGDIHEANTFYQDEFDLAGKCDFVMANPPFNVDKVDAEKVKEDKRRLPFGLPGVNKDKKVTNGNYLWISYFWSYLNEKGRAGFVMSSQASSAGHGEAEVRRKIVETGDVDVMLSIRSNFFYTRSVPCELWFFDKGKPKDRRDKVLMLDARNVFRKVSRRVNDFSPEQQQNLAAIVWLYRGQTSRFTTLVQSYLNRTVDEAGRIAAAAEAFKAGCAALVIATEPFLKTLQPSPAASRHPLPKGEGRGEGALLQVVKERNDAAKACFDSLGKWPGRIERRWSRSCKQEVEAQDKRLEELAELATACRDLVKDVDLVFKLSSRLVDGLDSLPRPAKSERGKNSSTPSPLWGEGRGEGKSCPNVRVLQRLLKELDARRKDLVEQLKQTAYFQRQAHWLLSRFPEAEFRDVPGLCRVVTKDDIEKADWSLTPGRFVGVAPQEVDEDFDFEQAIRDIHVELADLNKEAAALAERIQQNLEELGA